ncbi:carbamoyltransferase HypF [Streptomyces sp. TRM68367]|uniref:carbamoyltransferase HypF n=1 Tax=Streptomyces sp. TRM68367 TaxID=2758415 RepID=UPI00165A47D3|nr:carbamoyltransferase HypF [Streptomyces sp. TRM68367]MBC9726539.1 carbamoyltransferase HypF [Streptomyces sp. TRM68367]
MDTAECWRVRVTGVVQGVGFRPFVYRLAQEHSLTGWVNNDSAGVFLEAQGHPRDLSAFTAALSAEAPPLARVDEVSVKERLPASEGREAFVIRASENCGSATTVVPADSHVCDDCLAEIRDPADRRYRYPFVNCTHCGPRYSLIRGLPYDRAATTMVAFPMCADCEREYRDPLDRRYHAQPTACPHCGPKLTASVLDEDGRVRAVGESEEALTAALDTLQRGGIVAVKSVGGFHLAADARNADAVALLRTRKRRDSKPFAVMVSDLAAVDRIAWHTQAEDELMLSPARPIVLLRKREAVLPDSVAPRNPNLGVMLPSAPLHHLLLDRAGMDVLVMTSGNVSGYPIEFRNEDALERLFEVADLVLHHDRDIETRVDDSVMRTSEHPELSGPLVTFLRRSRGYAPYALHVPIDMSPVVGLGAELKVTVSLARGRSVYMSQHIGDVKNDETFDSHRTAAEHLARLYELAPSLAACDLHPDFRASVYARDTYGGEVEEVQHHHAHMSACMAENQLTGATIGVVFDGFGYGLDGTVWGGEFLLGDYCSVERVAHLRRFPLLGGDQAVREPVRTGFALAVDALGDKDAAAAAFPALGALDEQQQSVYAVMAARGINSPRTSSMGRLFDGAAALLGICGRAEYEAQGPIELEGLLRRELEMAPTDAYQVLRQPEPEAVELDWRPLIRALAADVAAGIAPAAVSRRFHSGIVAMVLAECDAIRREHGINQVVLSGGVFLNEFLLVNCLVALRKSGFEAHCHQLVPTNDGGISLGQAVVASARQAKRRRAES